MQERASSENGDVVAAFFFHGRGKPIQRTKLGLFRSLLNQIIPRFPEVLQLFAEFHQQHIQERGQKWKWGENELRDFFADHLPEASKARPIIIFVDALDEAGRGADSEVARFFVRLISTAKRYGGKLKVCLSSRHYPGLNLGPAQSISVDAENDEDIGTAVRDRLGDLDGSPKRRQELEHEIVSRAKGIFHWAIIVAEDVRHKWNARENFSVIQRSIKKTPDSLHSLYAEILDETKPEERPQTLKLLRWVCFAVRPLSTLELQHALALDFDMTYTKVKHYRKDDSKFPENLEYMAEVIGKLSKGLVEVVEHNDTNQAQFIHQAVEDYLMESGLARLALDGKEERDRPLNSTAATAQADGLFEISRSCIKYLKLKDIRKHVEHPPPPGESPSSVAAYLHARLPLAAYALSSLKPHLRDLEAEGIDQSDLLSLLSFPDDDGHILGTWHSLAKRLDLAASSTKTQEASASASVPAPLEKDTRLLHLLAECGIASALRPALAVPPNDSERVMALLSATDALGRTPLALAAREGHAGVVALLLEGLTRHQSRSDGKISLPDDGGVIPLADPPATINLPDVHGVTPLTHAAAEGHEEVVRLLLRFGAKVKNDGDDASSPLVAAMQNGHGEVVSILQEVSAGGLVEFPVQEGK
ncbi:hypothetical protein BFW01_g8091 [Lasiodiplodia theobromae]|nr:hypothetical protein BFW01_g8091 [Lasiodiplodia theobromae]